MCGIGGIIDFNNPRQPEALRTMAAAMAHRGPNATGYYEEGRVNLVHLRLSILDTQARGNQPMHSPDGRYTIVHNGEIYNFKELRAHFPGHHFQTETDTEVVLAAYDKWGQDCVRHFNGMFAFAIWDSVKETLFIARDRLGIKPLYFHFDGKRFAFASEVRALMTLPWVDRKIDPDSLAEYLSYQTVYGDNTLIQGIRLLEPGMTLIWAKHPQGGEGDLKAKVYWRKGSENQPWEGSMSEAHQTVRTSLSKAVERRMLSDVPLGAFLSGGIDSSAIVALMAQASDQPVDTFSVVFDEKAYDESAYSAMIAQKYQTRHHPILLKPSDFLEALPHALKSMDHPSGDGINSYVVAQVTKAKGITVALSGLGGDELFAGYPLFTQIPAIQKQAVWKLPHGMRKLLANLYLAIKSGRQAEKKAALLRLPSNDLDQIYAVYRTVFNDEDARAMVIGATHPVQSTAQMYAKLASVLFLGLSATSLAEITTYTHSVLLRDMDQMSMAHALEARVPFFDHELVETVLSMPDRIKWPKYTKSLLVESLGDLLPQEVVHRKKMGFVFPWEDWLRGSLKGFADDRIRSLQSRGIMDPDQLGKVWQEFQAGKGPWIWPHIWLPVVLEEWMQNNGFS